VKRAALGAIDASKPADVFFGRVESASPLRVEVGQKLVLGARQLALTRAVADHDVEITVDLPAGMGGGPDGGDAGSGGGDGGGTAPGTSPGTPPGTPPGPMRMRATVHCGLKKGDKVALLRRQGGQKYFVLGVVP